MRHFSLYTIDYMFPKINLIYFSQYGKKGLVLATFSALRLQCHRISYNFLGSIMIQLMDVGKAYGGQVLFENINFALNKGEKCALVGKNGTGKTTLMRLISGEEEADSGVVRIPPGYRVGMLKQHLHFKMPTVIEEACLILPPDREHEQYRAEELLCGLGFTEEDLYKDPNTFSGGYQIRIELCKLLLSEPNCMLLDEPSNYLDVVSMRWLGRFLREVKAEVILISHDRDFLDEVSTHTIGIHRGKLKKVEGGTEEYYTQVLQEEEIHERTRVNLEKQKAHLQNFVERFGAKASKATQAKSKAKAIERLPVLEKLASIHHLDFDFHYSTFNSQKVLTASNIAFAYPGMDAPLIQDFNFLLENGQKVAIIGKNGKGKSTLLKMLAQQLQPQQGNFQVSEQVKIGYFGQTNIDRLDPKRTIYEEIALANPQMNMSQIKRICGTMMFPSETANKTIGVLSGGERSRVLLGKILATPCNLLLLDEPTNHLDMESVEALVTAVEAFQGAVMIVTHTEWILHRIAKKLIVCSEDHQMVFDGTYEDFLRKIGWEEETPKKAKKAEKSKPQPQPQPTPKPEVSGPKPSKFRIAAIEKEITETSIEIEKITKLIEEVSAGSDRSRLTELSKELADQNVRLEKLYAEYEKASG